MRLLERTGQCLLELSDLSQPPKTGFSGSRPHSLGCLGLKTWINVDIVHN